MNTNPSAVLSPIRIYILWHPDMDKSDNPALRSRGITLARRIYHWFRMENMEGIPVYFRSAPIPSDDDPLLKPTNGEARSGVRNYIIPLVDANMVASPEWRTYVAKLAAADDDASKDARTAPANASRPEGGDASNEKPTIRMLPVALEPVAYNMPDSMREINYIRHIPADDSPPDDAELVAKLTEVLCRDLRYWLQRITKDRLQAHAASVPGKIRIFLSHAKADDTDEALAIKQYIQRNTQCEAFFDETDIASGYNFKDILEQAVKGESAGLIVIQGDNYADRPWCRKEIRDFLMPVKDPLAELPPHSQYFIPPVVVVQTMKGRQIGRTIPELGYSPCVRWNPNAAGFVVTTLLREILFGLFYRVLADRIASTGSANNQVFINRAPDPVMLSRILKELSASGPSPVDTVIHPGYGLSKIEKDGLLAASVGIGFKSFLEYSTPKAGDSLSQNGPLPPEFLSGKIIALSIGTPEDILATGQSDEHMSELLTRLLRPLVVAGASLIYGGRLPETLRPANPWTAPINFTALLLNLLLSEHEITKCEKSAEGQPSGTRPATRPRLYITVPWHARKSLTTQDIAQWLDICSFLVMDAEQAGINPEKIGPKPEDLDPDDLDEYTPVERKAARKLYRNKLQDYEAVQSAITAVSLSSMRNGICTRALRTRLHDVPADMNYSPVETFAHILLGGATMKFKGAMPGIFEEALYAIQNRKPVFLIGACGGASALLATQLDKLANTPRTVKAPQPPPPPELTQDHYEQREDYRAMLEGIKSDAILDYKPVTLFTELWTTLTRVKDMKSLAALLNNGLTGEENIRLFKATSFGEISGLVAKGIRFLTAP